MTLQEAQQKIGLTVVAAKEHANREVTGGYASDLLSDVLANASEGNIWITMQSHLNIVAVAVMKGISAIVIVNGRKPDEQTISKADQEKMPIMLSALPAFEVIGRLYSSGVRGTR